LRSVTFITLARFLCADSYARTSRTVCVGVAQLGHVLGVLEDLLLCARAAHERQRRLADRQRLADDLLCGTGDEVQRVGAFTIPAPGRSHVTGW